MKSFKEYLNEQKQLNESKLKDMVTSIERDLEPGDASKAESNILKKFKRNPNMSEKELADIIKSQLGDIDDLYGNEKKLMKLAQKV